MCKPHTVPIEEWLRLCEPRSDPHPPITKRRCRGRSAAITFCVIYPGEASRTRGTVFWKNQDGFQNYAGSIHRKPVSTARSGAAQRGDETVHDVAVPSGRYANCTSALRLFERNPPASPQAMPLPTHSAVTRFVASLLPLKDNDVPLLYHIPRRRRYDAEFAFIDRIVLSITPTPGVYPFIGHTDHLHALGTLCFLHRPWQLDRRALRGDTLVLSSHTSFDENLTVGWNPALATRLGMAEGDWFCVKGYKGDAKRKIGIVGSVSSLRHNVLQRIQAEFGQTELVQEGQSDEICVVAIMNAFNEEEVLRVLDMAQERALVPDASFEARGRHVLYLTGQPRESGLMAATALGLTVACVGHRTAEEWGIRFLAAALRNAFPDVAVEEVYEEEEPIVRKPKEGLTTSKIDLQVEGSIPQ